MKKKILSIVLCMALVLTAFSGVFAVSATDTTVTFPEYFTVTNDLSGRNGNTNNYCDYAEYGYVSRTPSILNPDGYSYKYTTSSTKGSSYPYVDAWSNFSNAIYADAVSNAKAVVAVISADINNTATAYPQNYEFKGIAQGTLTSVTTAYHLKADGSVTTYESYYADDYSDTHIALSAGETAIFISTIPEGTDIAAIEDCRANFHSKYNAKDAKYNGNVYYIDSIGLVSDIDAFVAAIPAIAMPTTVAAWNVKGDAGARWTLNTLYADMGIANYHVNIFDSTGAFVKSVTTAETEVTFAAVAGATYTVWVAGYDANGNRVTTPVKATTTVKTTNYNTTSTPTFVNAYGGYTQLANVTRTTNEHNPDGKSQQLTLSGTGSYPYFCTMSEYRGSQLYVDALVLVVSADSNNATEYPMRVAATNNQRVDKFDVVRIAADGTVTHLQDQNILRMPAGSTNYIIIDKSEAPTWTDSNITPRVWSDFNNTSYSSAESPLNYYVDSIGYAEDMDALINRLTATETVSPYFTVTKDTFVSGGYWSNYNEHGLVNRPVTAHNPDGTSFKIATNLTGGWNFADFYGCYKGVGEALVMVITVDETNVSAYPMHIGINGQNIQKFTLIKFDAEGNITTTQTISTINIEAGCTYYAIMSIADITEGANFNNPNSTMRIWTDYGEAKKYDSLFYVDAIGVASNKENLVTALTSGVVMSDITLENTEITVPEGNDIALGGNVVSGLILDKTYSVSDPNVISADGETLIAVGGGTAYASLTVDGYTDFANCKITVIPVDIGDVNYDGVCDILDLIRIKKYLGEVTDDIAKKGADCSEDGTIDVNDVTAVRKLLLGVQKKNQ